MDWSKGFSAGFSVSIVDPASWRDFKFYNITDGKIDRGSSESLMESADIDMTEKISSKEEWIRIYIDARQDGTSPARIALFTGLTSSPERKISGRRENYAVECYSVLKPMSDVLLKRGWYAPYDVNGAALAAKLLSLGPAPVSYADGAPCLAQSIIAEDGESYLSMAQKIINAIGWRLRISGNGNISIEPISTEIYASFDSLNNDVIGLEVSDSCDWYKCPNVFRAIQNDVSATARDDDPASILSTVSRGREIWKEETSCNLNSGETIAEYAQRRLKEEQSPSRSLSYDRRFDPSVTVGDLVRIHYPEESIDSIIRVSSQSLELGHSVKTTESGNCI